MSTRPDWQTFLVTLTVDPAMYGARPRSYNAYQLNTLMPLESNKSSIDMWDLDFWSPDMFEAANVRLSPHYLPPTLDQYRDLSSDMSKKFGDMRRRLTMRAKRSGNENPQYLRIAELHRNGWIHYHAVFQLPPGFPPHNLKEIVQDWELGRSDCRQVSAEDAVSHVVPYLTSEETHRNKGYQFAADALPKHFRLWTSSRQFLGESPDIVEAARKVIQEYNLPESLANDYIASMTPIQVVRDGRHVTHLLDNFRAVFDKSASVRWALHNDSQNPSRYVLNHESAPEWFATLPYFENMHRDDLRQRERRRLLDEGDGGGHSLPEAELLDDLTAFWLNKSEHEFFDNAPSRDWSACLSPPAARHDHQPRLYFGGELCSSS